MDAMYMFSNVFCKECLPIEHIELFIYALFRPLFVPAEFP